ncbi:MAG: hypothetical protein ACE5ID_08335 [Acidobacteriota bacterium]
MLRKAGSTSRLLRLITSPAGAALLYFGLALLITSPRLLGDGIYITDDWHDNEIFFWDFWWLKQALAGGHDPWFTTRLFYPAGTSLGFHPTAFLYAAFSLPFQAILGSERGVILAYNWITLASLVLASFFTFLLVRRLTGHHGAAVLSGLVFGFSPFHFWHLGRLHVGGLEWLPLYLLALLNVPGIGLGGAGGERAGGFPATGGSERWWRRLWKESVAPAPWVLGLALGGVATLLLYTSLTHLMSAALLTLLLLGRAARQHPGLFKSGSLWRTAAWAGLVGLVALAPFLHAWFMDPPARHSSRTLQENIEYSADAAGYLVPGTNHGLYGGASRRWGGAAARAGRDVFTGFLTLLLLPLAWRRRLRRETGVWLGLGAIFLILSLGPSLKVLGWQTGWPLPYRILHDWIPLFGVNRSPVRYAAVVQLCLAVLAGFSVRELLRRRRRAVWLVILALLAAGDAWTRPVFLKRQAAPEVFARIARSPEDAVVLNVPLYHAVVERRIMYQQIFHGRPLTTACIPRSSVPQHLLIQGTQLRACLLEAEGCARADPRVVRREILARKIGFILLHKHEMTPALLKGVDDLLTRAGPFQRVEDPAGLLVFAFVR